VVDAGRQVGTVGRLLALPSVEALEVERPVGEMLLVPLVRDCVRSVSLSERTVDVDLAFLGDTLPADLAPATERLADRGAGASERPPDPSEDSPE
jgi:hypothetical protein